MRRVPGASERPVVNNELERRRALGYISVIQAVVDRHPEKTFPILEQELAARQRSLTALSNTSIRASQAFQILQQDEGFNIPAY